MQPGARQQSYVFGQLDRDVDPGGRRLLDSHTGMLPSANDPGV